jgi:hypothetical protein
MRFHPAAAVLLLCLGAAACGPSVTGDDIDEEIEQELSSVVGAWHGASSGGSSVITLDFTLQAGAGTAVTGSGTMKETAAPSAVPITVTGTFNRPNLSLTFSGMTFEGHAVTGTFAGNYTQVGGIVGTLHLAGTGYNHDIQVLIAEV